ncbi:MULTISPECIES: hypothetical protein [Aminiphilus]|mgnify:CR=1 FL=1|uniref:hypothetical protein n=1 Tax=Aminiphilus TaxID=290731 RepID=UPI0004786675|nr:MULTISPECIES: hypothetical protein [Aminiphilus]
MAGKIFYRERRKIEEKERRPRFRVVAALGADVAFFAQHLRRQELEQIAREAGAELVKLEGGSGEGCGGGPKDVE